MSSPAKRRGSRYDSNKRSNSQHHFITGSLRKSEKVTTTKSLIEPRIIAIHAWNDIQLQLLADTVLKESGFITTFNETMEIKWKIIKSKLENSKGHEFIQTPLPLWEGLYKQYKQFKRDLLKHYEIDPGTIDTNHLIEENIKDWALLIIKMERYRVATNQYPTDMARLDWKKKDPWNFFGFITLCFFFVGADILLVGFKGRLGVYVAQIIVMTISFIIFIYGVLMTMIYFPKDYPINRNIFKKHEYVQTKDADDRLIIIQYENLTVSQQISFNNRLSSPKVYEDPSSTSLHSKIYISQIFDTVRLCLDKETAIEFLCYLMGFCFIDKHQGLSALRVFRLFRFLSYLKYVDDMYDDDDVPPETRPFSPTKAAKLFAFYMEQLFQEFVTQKSLGGTLILAIFFFTTYCVAVVFWNDKSTLVSNSGETCLTLRECYMTMLRLVFYDGVGLDYLNALVEEGSHGYIFLIWMYAIFNGIVLVNGLIGIFGATFMSQDERVEETHEKLCQVEDRLEALTLLLQEKFYDVTSGATHPTSGSSGESGGGNNNNNNSSGPAGPSPVMSSHSSNADLHSSSIRGGNNSGILNGSGGSNGSENTKILNVSHQKRVSIQQVDSGRIQNDSTDSSVSAADRGLLADNQLQSSSSVSNKEEKKQQEKQQDDQHHVQSI